jgi:deoxyribodipyrimidine photolyase-related protein
MSDYCADCQFDPKDNCPLTNMYWHFLDRHEDELDGNRRLGLMLHQMRNRSDEQRAHDRAVFEQTRRALKDGETLSPDEL